jgi:hypothetical protein
METKPKPLIAMPYTQDLNDSIIYAIEHHQTGEFHNRLVRSVEALDHEGGPRVLSMGLHPHLMGVPHRMQEMRKMLDFLQSRPNVTFVKPAATIDWFKEWSL